MSNARSPREVCSTTIGTSGLIVRLCFASPTGFLQRRLAGRSLFGSRSSISRCTQPPGLLAALGGLPLLRRPQRLARLRLRRRNRLGGGGEQVDRLARRQILADLLEAAGRAQVLEQRLRLDLLVLGSRFERLQQLLLGGADLALLHDRGDDGLATQRELRFGLHLAEHLGLLAPGD